jgi:hypothetical protein
MIPKIIHQTWRSDELPNVFQKIYDKNKDINKGFEFKLWSHSPGPPTIDEFMKNEYPDIYPIFEKAKFGVQKADISRLAILHHFGGIYYDLDILCLKPIEELLDMNSDFVYAAMEPAEQTMAVFKKDNVLCNAFIAAPPKHRIFQTALDTIKKLYENRGDSIFNIFNVFGADIVTISMTLSEENYKQCKYVNRTLIYPITDPKLVNLPSCEKSVKMLKQGEYNDAYMIHYWIHSDFESKEKLDTFSWDDNKTFHQNIYTFFQELYPDNKYLRN